MSDELHPYDGVERRFRDTDDDPSQRARGRDLVAGLLGLPAPPTTEGLRYDLCFYSGGIGCIDRLNVALPCAAAEVDAIVARRGFVTPGVIVSDAATREDFESLLGDDGDGQPLAALAREFVLGERVDFQPVPAERARVWFDRDSGVNSWTVVYEQDGRLCLIAFDQG